MQTKRLQIRILNPSLVSHFRIIRFFITTIVTICSFIDSSFTSLRLEIAKEEAALTETSIEQPHEMTPSQLIQKGLDLEEQQSMNLVICILVL